MNRALGIGLCALLLGGLSTVAQEPAAPLTYDQAVRLRESAGGGDRKAAPAAFLKAAAVFDAVGAKSDALLCRLQLLHTISGMEGYKPSAEELAAIDRLVADAKANSDNAMLAAGLLGRGELRRRMGDTANAVVDVRAGAAAARAIGSGGMVIQALMVLSGLHGAGMDVGDLGPELDAGLAAANNKALWGSEMERAGMLRGMAHFCAAFGRADSAIETAATALRLMLEVQPEAAGDAVGEMGWAILQQIGQGRINEYADRVLEIITEKPMDAPRCAMLVRLGDVARDNDKVKELLRTAADTPPAGLTPRATVGLHLGAGRVALAAGDKQAAAASARKAAEVLLGSIDQPEAIDLLGQVSDLARDAGDLALARETVDGFLAKAPAERVEERARALLIHARVEIAVAPPEQGAPDQQEKARQAAMKDTQAARDLLTKAPSDRPSWLSAAMEAGGSLVELGDPLSAVAILTQAQQSPGLANAPWLVGSVAWQLARAHHAVGADEAAADQAERFLATQGSPDAGGMHMLLVAAGCIESAGKTDRALELYAKAAQMREAGDQTQRTLLAFRIAGALAGRGKLAEARAALAEAGAPADQLGQVAGLIDAGLAAKLGDTDAARALVAKSADAMMILTMPFGQAILLGVEGAVSPGDLRRLKVIHELVAIGLEAGGGQAPFPALSRLVLAETENGLGEYQTALDVLTPALPTLEGMGGEFSPRAFRAAARSYEGLGQKDKAAEMRVKAGQPAGGGR